MELSRIARGKASGELEMEKYVISSPNVATLNPLPIIWSKYFKSVTKSNMKSTTTSVNKKGPIKDPNTSLSIFFIPI